MATQTKRKRIDLSLERPLVLMSGLDNEVAEAAVEYVRDWGWDLQALWITDFEWPTDRPVSGALIGEAATAPIAKRLLAAGIPTVRLGKLRHRDDAILPAVLADEDAQGRLAAEHFHQRGFKHVGFVGFHPEGNDADHHNMFVAFRSRAADLGLTCDLLSLGDVSIDESASRTRARTAATAQWLAELPKPVGIFSFADYMIVRVFIACRQAGLAVPEQVALLGSFNSVSCQLTSVALSSIDPANARRIRVALRLLRDLMAGKPGPREPVLVPPQGVVVRTSTDVLAVPDLAIAKALRFIWEHYAENLSIQDIADAVGMPRRSLERGFRTHLNRSVHAELNRKRVEELRNLLLSTNEPLVDLAPRAGFFTLSNANRCFCTNYGVAPGKYRAQQGAASRSAH